MAGIHSHIAEHDKHSTSPSQQAPLPPPPRSYQEAEGGYLGPRAAPTRLRVGTAGLSPGPTVTRDLDPSPSPCPGVPLCRLVFRARRENNPHPPPLGKGRRTASTFFLEQRLESRPRVTPTLRAHAATRGACKGLDGPYSGRPGRGQAG